jgi:ribosome-binding protein aMBF1 (putative translation factor)
MKEKPNYDEVEKKVDFKALASRLNALSEKDNRQRRTVYDVLDHVRGDILAARQKRKVSYKVLAKELTAAGIPISEPTLRKYIQSQGIAKKRRNVPIAANGNGEAKPTSPLSPSETKPEKPTRQHRFNLDA